MGGGISADQPFLECAGAMHKMALLLPLLKEAAPDQFPKATVWSIPCSQYRAPHG